MINQEDNMRSGLQEVQISKSYETRRDCEVSKIDKESTD